MFARVIIFITCHLAFAIFLTSCDAWTFSQHGSEGDPCFTDGTCEAGLVCCADVCQSSCSGDGDMETDGTDGDTTDGDADGDVTDGDTTDGDATDGDVTDGDATDGDVTDGDVTDGDVTDGDVTDGDVTDGDADGDDDIPCVCNSTDECCLDGCHWDQQFTVCETDEYDCTIQQCDVQHQCKLTDVVVGNCFIDEKCVDKGAAWESNECRICDPDLDKYNYSNASMETPCELPETHEIGHCSSGFCYPNIEPDGDTDTDADVDADADADNNTDGDADPNCECSEINVCCDGCLAIDGSNNNRCGHCQWCQVGICVELAVDANKDPFNDCQECEVCGGANNCRNANDDTDPKDECTAGDCTYDHCVGGTCRKDDHVTCGDGCKWCENGACSFVPISANEDPDYDCPVCEVCNGSGGCRPADESTNPKGECVAGECTKAACTNGSCNMPDGSTCGSEDQCVSGECLDCYDDDGCSDLDWNGRVDHCSNRVCTNANTCTFYDLSSDFQCPDADICYDSYCNGSGQCGPAQQIPNDCEAMTCGESPTGCFTCSCPDGTTCDTDSGKCYTNDFVSIEAGTFWMGSPDGSCPADYPGDCINESGRTSNREELHEVTLTYDFEMMKYEVTQRNWTALIPWNPGQFTTCDGGDGSTCPVENVSWYDTLVYANKLSEAASLTPCYVFTDVLCEDSSTRGSDYNACMNATQGGIDSATVTFSNNSAKPQDCEGYRLPTEAEWEYAVRSGSEYTAYHQSTGNDGTADPLALVDCLLVDSNLTQIAWYCGNAGNTTHPVGVKEGNTWGLYDMSGNAFEWTWDWHYDSYQNDSPIDPTGLSASGTYRVERGGNYYNNARDCRSALRGRGTPGIRSDDLGFRLVRTTGRSGMTCTDGVCTDLATGLDWQETPDSGSMLWDVAKTYCQSLTLDGGGWHLPNISELRSLVRNCSDIGTGGACAVKDECSACSVSFDGTCLSDSCHVSAACYPSSCSNDGGPTGCYWPEEMSGTCSWNWSASAVGDIADVAWRISFMSGYLDYNSTDVPGYVRCVR